MSAAPRDLDGLLATEGWRSAEQVFARMLTDLFQRPAVPTALGEPLDTTYVADILLIEPARQLEIGVSVLADDASMRAMARHLFGDDEREEARALVLEISNLAMGVLQTALAEDGHTFTAGIPLAVPLVQARDAFDAHPVRRRFAVVCGDARLELWVRAREKTNNKVLGRNLKEGMVIGEDVHDAQGMLLFRAGTRLSQTSAERVARIAPDLEVIVGDARQ